jgi:hypothetical protein
VCSSPMLAPASSTCVRYASHWKPFCGSILHVLLHHVLTCTSVRSFRPQGLQQQSEVKAASFMKSGRCNTNGCPGTPVVTECSCTPCLQRAFDAYELP